MLGDELIQGELPTLKDKRHLFSGNFNLMDKSFYRPDDMQATMSRLENDPENPIFVEEFTGKNRGSTFYSTAVLYGHTYELVMKDPIIKALVESIRCILAQQWGVPPREKGFMDTLRRLLNLSGAF